METKRAHRLRVRRSPEKRVSLLRARSKHCRKQRFSASVNAPKVSARLWQEAKREALRGNPFACDNFSVRYDAAAAAAAATLQSEHMFAHVAAAAAAGPHAQNWRSKVLAVAKKALEFMNLSCALPLKRP